MTEGSSKKQKKTLEEKTKQLEEEKHEDEEEARAQREQILKDMDKELQMKIFDVQVSTLVN